VAAGVHAQGVGGSALDRDRLGLRFVDPASERRYREWHLHQTLPFVRFGLLAAAVAWIGNWIPHFMNGADPARSAPLMLGVGVGGMVLAALCTWTGAGRRRCHLLAGAGVVASGFVSVTVSFEILDDWTTAGSGTIIIAYFGLAVFRLRPAVATTCAGTVIGGFLVALAADRDRLGVTDRQMLSATTLSLTALGTGVLLSIFVDRLSRTSFAQGEVIAAQQDALAAEHDRAEGLLENVLPRPIADRLKGGEARIADGFDEVTVLFADIVGFTPLAATIPATEVVTMLDEVFTRFDDLVDHYGAEKIKTIGDAYMAVVGVPTPRPDHVAVAAELALAMRDSLVGQRLLVRIGIATGPAVAGVIGRRKFAYDLWGDTVNTASRMESHGTPGHIQVTDAVRLALADRFELEDRGMVDLKGRGPIRAWYLLGPKEDGRQLLRPVSDAVATGRSASVDQPDHEPT
jgi:class 3 adenylate cyclase